MKLDSNLAWKDASRNVWRNRDALAAVAGVFFLLPQLALALFYPQPEPTAGMNQQQIVALVQGYYLSTLPLLIPMLFLQALGTISLLSLLSHAARPTVAQALRLGLTGAFTYLGAQLLLGVAIGLIGGIVLGALTMVGGAAVAVAVLVVIVAAAVAIGVRASLTAPVVAIEGERNPIRALIRSWQLSKGNVWRMIAFYALFLVAFLVVQMMVGVALGIPLAVLASPPVAQLISAVVSSTLNAIMALYLVAIIGAVHSQLAGSDDRDRALFE